MYANVCTEHENQAFDCVMWAPAGVREAGGRDGGCEATMAGGTDLSTQDLTELGSQDIDLAGPRFQAGRSAQPNWPREPERQPGTGPGARKKAFGASWPGRRPETGWQKRPALAERMAPKHRTKACKRTRSKQVIEVKCGEEEEHLFINTRHCTLGPWMETLATCSTVRSLLHEALATVQFRRIGKIVSEWQGPDGPHNISKSNRWSGP